MTTNDKSYEDRVGIPMRPFLYTVDQIATMLQVSEERVRKEWLHYEGRSVGFRPPSKLSARNISPEGVTPEWRVSDRELARWLSKKGYRIYLRGWVTH